MPYFIGITLAVGSVAVTNIADIVPGACINYDDRDVLPPVSAPICLEIIGLENDYPFIGR